MKEYERMFDVGMLTSDDRVELIHGEIVEKMPPTNPHTHALPRFTNCS